MIPIRTYRPADIPALVELRKATGAMMMTTAVQLQTALEAPGIDPEQNVYVVERAGRIIAYADSEIAADTGSAWSECAVHPDVTGQGIGTALIRQVEANILQRAGALCPPDMPVSITRGAPKENEAAHRLFEAEGYAHVRSAYRMRIELDQPVEVPPLPEGIRIRPFQMADARSVYEVQQEAFRDTWGFEAAPWEEWEYFVIKSSDADPSLWLTAHEGEEMVGICVCRPYREYDPDMAYVRMLGVRRPWRKHGVGMALLKSAFAQFQARGFKRAALGVDASSLTNAVALYQRAGMHIWKQSMTFRKMLRGEAAK